MHGKSSPPSMSRLDPVLVQAALDRHGLGTLAKLQAAHHGRSGLTWGVTTDRGHYLLRAGRSLSDLKRERYFARLIHDHTGLNSPWPYAIDPDSELLGLPYAFMPRLPGTPPADVAIWRKLSAQGRALLARGLGEGLRELQSVRSDRPGTFSPESDQLVALPQGYAVWYGRQIERRLDRLLTITGARDDVTWVESRLSRVEPALSVDFVPRFVHHDFTVSNVLAELVNGLPRITGVIDLQEGYFGLGEADLARTVAMFGREHPDRVEEFVRGYFGDGRPTSGFAERFSLFMLEDRLCVWLAQAESGAQTGSFRAYAEPYLQLGPRG